MSMLIPSWLCGPDGVGARDVGVSVPRKVSPGSTPGPPVGTASGSSEAAEGNADLAVTEGVIDRVGPCSAERNPERSAGNVRDPCSQIA